MIRRLGLLLLAAAVLGGTASAAPGKDPRDPKKRLNPADQAWARGIRIQRTDLGRGNWRLEPSDDDDDSDAPAGCKNPDMSDLVLTGESEDREFSRNGSVVSSGADVWADERQATVAWKRGERYPFAKCMRAAMKQEIAKDPRVRLTIQSTGRIPIAKLAPRMLTFRMRFQVKGSAGALNGRLSFYFFSRGRADAMFMVLSFGKPLSPISESFEHRLAALVADRLER